MSEHELDADRAPTLAAAVEALRSEVPVRRQWREGVLREVGELPTPRRSQLELIAGGEPALAKRGRRSWWRSPWTAAAVAAAILMVAVVVVRRGSPLDAPTRLAGARAEAAPRATLASSAADARSEELFSITAPGAARVSLVGDFNQWHAGVTPLRPVGDGRTWAVELALPPGRHVYAFVVDGKIVPDPAAPRAADDDFGVPNSVAIIAVSN
ncbi:MAG TPA: isoamylase early set domain-containing protein [Gemmatimonadaceae bacterium]|nr:isoamylase early set domain-containing protein [Gemmatimonadaceae bacterium]